MWQQDVRKGFTLIELLVVIALISILAAIAITFFPSAASAQREARGAIAVQGWLNIAKQRALRDNSPRGVRFYLTTVDVNGVNLPNMVSDAAYIEQPSDFHAGPKSANPNDLSTLAAVGSIVGLDSGATGTGSDFTNGQLPPTGQPLWNVQPGDYIEFRGGGLMHRVTSVTGTNALMISPPVASPIQPTPNYRIMRSPRVAGDEALKMPNDVYIDAKTNFDFNNALPMPNFANEGAGFFDILFAPNGSVISKGVSGANIHLWIRSPNPEQPADPFRGQPSIISVFVRTGFAGSFDVDPVTMGNPYTLVR
jgi:prepilin-type N-terminal cleavage/methylation domain-containing protein